MVSKTGKFVKIGDQLSLTNDLNGKRVFEFQGYGWLGDLILQDIDNTDDRWACGMELFGGTGWSGTFVEKDFTLIYSKPGKPTIAVEVPEGLKLITREGPRVLDKPGYMLACSKADDGDFYVWTPDVVAKYIKDYKIS